MFDKLKQFNELRNLQKNIKKERAEATKNGVKIVIDGSFDIIELKLNPEIDINSQERAIKDAFAEAKDNMQKTLAKNFAGSLFG